MFRIGYSPSPLPGLDGLVLALEASFDATIALGAFFVAFLLLFFAVLMSAMHSLGFSFLRD